MCVVFPGQVKEIKIRESPEHVTAISGYDVQPAESTAKFCVRKPGGAIRRKERIWLVWFGSFFKPGKLDKPGKPLPLSANGLESHPLGSAGKVSRPTTVKLLLLPSATAAHRWLKSADAMSGFCERGMICPLAGEMGD